MRSKLNYYTIKTRKYHSYMIKNKKAIARNGRWILRLFLKSVLTARKKILHLWEYIEKEEGHPKMKRVMPRTDSKSKLVKKKKPVMCWINFSICSWKLYTL